MRLSLAMFPARFAAAALIFISGIAAVDARAQSAQEFAIKASFITKFVPFVQWPAGAKAKEGPPEPFVVAVVGDNPFRDELENAFRSLDLGGRPVRIRTVSDADDLGASNIVFIPGTERDRLVGVLRWAEKNGALTIGDGEGFAEAGAIINFYRRDDKVRFEINARAAEKNGFQISSLLLKVARIVGEK